MNSQIDLLPCPFCGTAVDSRHHLDFNVWLITCMKKECRVAPFISHKEKKKAEALWNTRANPAPDDKLVEALEDMLGWMAQHEGYCVCSKCESIRKAEAALASHSARGDGPGDGEKSGPSDTEMLNFVEKFLTHMPNGVIAYNDDPDVECDDTPDGMAPVGFRIVHDGCQGIFVYLGDSLRAAITSAMQEGGV